MEGIKCAVLAASVCVGALAAGQVDAQVTQAGSIKSRRTDAPAVAKEPVKAEAGAPASDIVVTGSRVITNGNASPTPVTTVTPERLLAVTPSNIPDGLNKLPVFSGSQGQRSTGNNDSNTAGNFLNLRNIGIARTLILFDGHRLAPSSAQGTVDTNTIPQMLLQRVDVVTGGVSAVYGSDAITGVVNFVVDRKFNGLKTVAQAGVSERGDAPSRRIGAAGGIDLFGGRGHLLASFEHYSSDGLFSNSDRSASSRIITTVGSGTQTDPFRLVENARSVWIQFNGHPLYGPNGLSSLYGYQFGDSGSLLPFRDGTPVAQFLEVGGDGGYVEPVGLTASLRTDQAYGRFDFDLTDKVRFYAQGSYTEARNSAPLAPFLYLFQTIDANNAFLPAQAKTILANAGEDFFVLGKAQKNAAPLTADGRTRNIFGNAGFAGTLFEGANFDLSYTHAETRLRFTNENNTASGRLAAALDAVVAPDGQIVCRTTLTNPGLYPGCVPINPFGPNSESAAALAYVRSDTGYTLTNKLDDLAGSISGSPFSTWAGPVRVALSGEWRRQTLRNVSTDQPTALDCTGLRYNCVPGSTTVYVSNVAANAYGSQSVEEGAVEVNVPLLANSAIARALNLNGAARYANYRTSGGAWTWKVGIDWQVTDDLRLRATRSRDFRAPTLFDLFQPVTLSQSGYTDLHTGVSAIARIQRQGNPDLRPETGNTLTVGAVYRPHWLPGASFAVDYYRIRIDDAITTISASDQSIQRQCEVSNGTSPLCALYVRPLGFADRSAANYPTLLLTQSLNVATLKSHGIDAEANYVTAFAHGDLSVRGLLSYQPDLTTQQTPGDLAINGAGAIGVSKWRATAFVSYTIGPVGLAVQESWRSKQAYSNDPRIFYAIAPVHAVAITDLTATFNVKSFGKTQQFFLSVQNLFDKDPPIYAASAPSAPGYSYPAVPGDQILGRYFTAGFRANF